MPTPAGVPVRIRSPGSSVNAPEAWAMSAGTSKIRSLVARVLQQLGAEPLGDPESRSVAELVDRHERRQEGAERVEALRADPLLVPGLDRPRADVVRDGVPGDVGERVVARDPPPAASDHHGELCLRVHVRVFAREHDRLAGLDQRGRELGEQDRRLGQIASLLGGVIVVVQPDADDLPRPVDLELLPPELADRHRSAFDSRSRPSSKTSSVTASEIRAQPSPFAPKPSPGASARRCSVSSRSAVSPGGSSIQT